MAGYKIQLKDKNGNRQYPVSTVDVVVDADGVSVADLLDRKQPTLVSGVNIKTINGKTLLGEGDLVIEGGTADLSGYATEEYVDAKVGESYPIYYSHEGNPLTEEQKAVNKKAYDVLVASFGQDAFNVPHLYPYDLGKQFPFIPYELNEDDGYVVMFLNIDATPAPFSDLGLSLSGTGLHTISQGFQLYSDGRVTNDFSGSYIIPDLLAMSELINGKRVQPRWLYASIDGSISDSMKEYNKETIGKIANGENIKLAIWPIFYPVEYSFEDGDGIVFTVSVVINDSLRFGQGVINSDGSCEYEEYTFAQGGGSLLKEVIFYICTSLTAVQKATNVASYNAWMQAGGSHIKSELVFVGGGLNGLVLRPSVVMGKNGNLLASVVMTPMPSSINASGDYPLKTIWYTIHSDGTTNETTNSEL